MEQNPDRQRRFRKYAILRRTAKETAEVLDINMILTGLAADGAEDLYVSDTAGSAVRQLKNGAVR